MKKANQYEYIDGKRYGLVSIPLHKTKSSARRVMKIDAGKYAVYSRSK